MTLSDDAVRPDAANHRPLRPREAASILLLDREGDRVRVLMGRRSRAHVFMPDVHVFPGGRRDRDDHRLRFATDLHPAVLARLHTVSGGRLSDIRMRALALAALRELHEETGLVIGRPSPDPDTPCLPDLVNLRHTARAITPPGHIRRFDTYFFALFIDETGADPAAIRDSAELEDLRWIDVNDTSSVTIPEITGLILGDLRNSLVADPALPFGAPVPFYHTRRGRLVRDLL